MLRAAHRAVATAAAMLALSPTRAFHTMLALGCLTTAQSGATASVPRARGDHVPKGGAAMAMADATQREYLGHARNGLRLHT